MSGLYVPLVLIPRFTSYLGAGQFTTEPLDVTAFSKGVVTVWCGPLIGATGASLEFIFEMAEDPDVWTEFPFVDPIFTPNGSDVVELPLTMRWLRLKLTLDDDAAGVVALTCWAMGSLEKREQG